ncbi:MAG: glycerophosphodiester phosphodiesterase [Flavobacteriales bacterium]|nr:glycerophosphodiester phosphodiesterase [Flavobacteriales bacterium]
MGCTRPDGPAPLIVGHGGAGEGGASPLNSLAGVKEAWALGADGVELDVQLSSDGQLFCYHPQFVKPEPGTSGFVNARSAEELASLGLARWRACFPRTPRVRALFVLDCKLFAAGEWSTYLDSFAASLGRTVQAHHLQGRVHVECRSTEFLDRVRERVSDVRVCYYADRVEEAMPTALEHRYGGITVPIGAANELSVRHARSQGLHVAVFGVQDRFAHHRAWSLAVDQVQSDDLAFAVGWR